jgi:hypothetical protein
VKYLEMEHRTYLWTLAALVVVYFGSIVAAALVPSIIGKIEAFGLGTITGGLIGLLRIPRQQGNPEIATGKAADPVHVAPETLDLTGVEVP